MLVWYTSHALEEMRRRRITEMEVEAVLVSPTLHGPAKEDRLASWGQVAGRSIMVIHTAADDRNQVTIVTAYPMRRRPNL
jgi:hypothetical protein